MKRLIPRENVRKKVIPFEVLPFSRFPKTTEMSWITSARLPLEAAKMAVFFQAYS